MKLYHVQVTYTGYVLAESEANAERYKHDIADDACDGAVVVTEQSCVQPVHVEGSSSVYSVYSSYFIDISVGEARRIVLGELRVDEGENTLVETGFVAPQLCAKTLALPL
jgi:hypothetical protein